MEILGIGPIELLIILVIALIILGPGDMVKAGLTIGRFLRKIITSPEWHMVQKASNEIRNLPNRLMREASIDDLTKDLADFNKIGGQLNNDLKKMEFDLSPWTTPPNTIVPKVDQSEPQDKTYTSDELADKSTSPEKDI
jgi:Sec-independent protein translocase protein TatA